MYGTFTNSALSRTNYENALMAWSGQTLKSNVSLFADSIKYCTAESARTSLISTHNWTITDGGRDCSVDRFITTWKTNNTGTSNSTSITIPMV